MGALEGRVVIITGAGNGIGRQHALVFAREGAQLVLNDTGGDHHGDGSDASVVQRVVDQVVAEGGAAVANTSDVAEWDTGRDLVDQALDTYGALDVVVNNAGILRHSPIADMSAHDFDRVVAVHLRGHFTLTRHAAAHWRARAEAGERVTASIVNTSSPQGLFGGRNHPDETELGFGIAMAQSNYDAAKAGILGLTLSSALELFQYGIRTNALCPFATTRLAELYPGRGALPDDWPGEEPSPGHPRQNSFIAAWLATESCPANGTVWMSSLGTLWQTWSQAGAIPLPEGGWPTVDGIGELVERHIGVGPLTVLGKPREAGA
jgi:NAD(P)-dependent dehydrogenase (short-subunit alcohol dehydrogenase family)